MVQKTYGGLLAAVFIVLILVLAIAPTGLLAAGQTSAKYGWSWWPFASSSYEITAIKIGPGADGGLVTSVPYGIDCGLTCSARFKANTFVTVYATSKYPYYFLGWAGMGGTGCSGTLPCKFPVTQNSVVYANFSKHTPNLTITKSGAGSGTVVSKPPGINCGTDCSETYTFGTEVRLFATPAKGNYFIGWSGACSGGRDSSPCTVSMTSNKDVTAYFSKFIDQ